jgi:hypothetical protein
MNFYHVDRAGSLQEGMVLNLAKSITSTNENCREIKIVPGKYSELECNKLIAHLFPSGLTVHGWRYLLQPIPVVQSQNFPSLWDHSNSVELLFETIRREQFPDSQSRFQSVFAWQSIEDARKFSQGANIYEIHADAHSIHDQTFLSMGTQGISAMIQGVKYWNRDMSESSVKEVLLAPPVTVGPRV